MLFGSRESKGKRKKRRGSQKFESGSFKNEKAYSFFSLSSITMTIYEFRSFMEVIFAISKKSKHSKINNKNLIFFFFSFSFCFSFSSTKQKKGKKEREREYEWKERERERV